MLQAGMLAQAVTFRGARILDVAVGLVIAISGYGATDFVGLAFLGPPEFAAPHKLGP